MLIKILYFIFIVVLIRFVAHSLRALLNIGGSKRKVSKKPTGTHPATGQRIVDVEFTEDISQDPGTKDSK